jgi:hypothetical protein
MLAIAVGAFEGATCTVNATDVVAALTGNETAQVAEVHPGIAVPLSDHT